MSKSRKCYCLVPVKNCNCNSGSNNNLNYNCNCHCHCNCNCNSNCNSGSNNNSNCQNYFGSCNPFGIISFLITIKNTGIIKSQSTIEFLFFLLLLACCCNCNMFGSSFNNRCNNYWY